MVCHLVGAKLSSNAGRLVIEPSWTNFSEILIEIHIFPSKKMHFEMSPGNWPPFCLGLNVLKECDYAWVPTHIITHASLLYKIHDPIATCKFRLLISPIHFYLGVLVMAMIYIWIWSVVAGLKMTSPQLLNFSISAALYNFRVELEMIATMNI